MEVDIGDLAAMVMEIDIGDLSDIANVNFHCHGH